MGGNALYLSVVSEIFKFYIKIVWDITRISLVVFQMSTIDRHQTTTISKTIIFHTEMVIIIIGYRNGATDDNKK